MALLSSSALRSCRIARPARQAMVQPAPFRVHKSRVQLIRAATKVADAETEKDAVEEFTDGPDMAPSTAQVTNFLTTLCDETQIAEVAVEMGNFKLRVKRNVGASASAPAAAPAAPAPMATQIIAMSPAVVEEAPEDSMDEALVYVHAPKVGVFRRGKYAGGKKVGKGNIADVGTTVKKGQTLGFVEQLGTFVPVEAPQAGEVVCFKIDDGAPTMYNEVIVELAPFFGGHIIGDNKYA